MYTFDNKTYDCPFDCFISIIKGKWRTSLLLALADGPLFFSKLQRQLPGISAKVLTENLHVFERNGLVHRVVYDTVPPSVEYSLTERGHKLILVMQSINGWMDDI
ncbi:helix-turn-helix domain-containing protein [Megasphaera sp.]|uniref:winged helix-turn-helix transcriptional regulator n=1 Tax=Megasphaera sp. TaxID=2023260 RepID=UPI001D7C6860|nr:helix-turn-helix domain-containing protein [Megasphaera sp.]MBS6103766.1 helix-turn-helix transcriptional regulator [Megasphaera sp.]